MAQAREGIVALFEQAMPGDEYQLVEFNDAPRLICPLTADKRDVQSALARVEPRGWTSLFDGVMLSAGLMRKAANPRRALVVLSDGEDNFSRYTQSELTSYLDEANVVIYSIGLADGLFVRHQTRYLRNLSERTGGLCFPVSRLERLADAVRSIGNAIRSQYLLGYSPSGATPVGKYRRIKVQLADVPAGLTLTWRSGYRAPE
jgi:Ca-activated chloride channel homolog